MNVSKLAALSLALAGTLGAGLAQARSDVQWSVSIPGPIGISLYSQPYAAPVYVQPRQVYAPVYVQPEQVYAPVYGQPRYVPAPVYVEPGYRAGWQDRDRDGIPNRYDTRYNPRWDRDGDGIPNRYDNHYSPQGARHGQVAYDRRGEQAGRGDRGDRGNQEGRGGHGR